MRSSASFAGFHFSVRSFSIAQQDADSSDPSCDQYRHKTWTLDRHCVDVESEFLIKRY